jgi:hypothetical protein
MLSFYSWQARFCACALLTFAPLSFAHADPPTLGDLLPRVAYNPARQGVLLAINPQNTLLAPGNAVLTDVRGLSLSAVTARYGRKPVTVGGITVIAPTAMYLLNVPDRLPDADSSNNQHHDLIQLMAALSPDQWERLAGPEGLTISDLSPQQQTRALKLLPTRIATRQGKTHTLSEQERLGAHLRLNYNTQLLLRNMAQENSYYVVDSNTAPSGDNDTPQWSKVDEDPNAEGDERTKPPLATQRKTVYQLKVTSQLKPGDINLSPEAMLSVPALRRGVSLSGIKTLGELVARTAKATGWELYADKRVAVLPLWVSNSESVVAAGDVLTALCWAVTGTWRRVGPQAGPAAYILTDDREGIGTRYARLEEWEMAARLQAEDSDDKAEERLTAQGIGSLLQFAPNDPFAVSKEIVERSFRAKDTPDGPNGRPADEVMLPTLSPALQQAAANLVKQTGEEGFSTPNAQVQLQADRGRLQVGLKMTVLLPGIGELPAADVDADDPFIDIFSPLNQPKNKNGAETDEPPPAITPLTKTTGRGTVLLLTARTPEEAKTAVHLARDFGFARLWLFVESADEKDILVAALAEAKPLKLPVGAVVPLLKAHRKNSSPVDEVDRNLLGEASSAFAQRFLAGPLSSQNNWTAVSVRNEIGTTGADWLRFDTPVFAAAHLNRLCTLAAIPGLASLAISDTLGPSYSPITAPLEENNGLASSGEFGYTPEMRLAFLRQEGYDPLDLCPHPFQSFAQPAILPFFSKYEFPPSKEEPEVSWTKLRNKTNHAFCVSLLPKLRAAQPTLPLLMMDRATYVAGGGSYWASWDIPEELPFRKSRYDRTGPNHFVYVDNTKLAQTMLLSLNVPRDESPVKHRIALRDVLEKLSKAPKAGPKWQGFVLNLRLLTVPRAELFLNGIFASPNTTTSK